MLNKKKLFLIFLLALAVRLAFFAAFAYHQGDFNLVLGTQDTGSFLNDAKNFYAGRGFSDQSAPPFAPDGIRTPVVPLILGLFGERYGAYILLQVLTASLSVVFLYLIGERLFGSTAATWASVFYALDPLSAFHSLNILSETYFTFFVMLAVFYLVKFWQAEVFDRRSLFRAGLFLGISALTRPVGVVLVPIFLLAILAFLKRSWSKKFSAALFLLIIFVLVISPWLGRNYRIFGAAGLSYIPAYNWYHFNARVFYAQQHNLNKEQAKQLFRKWEQEEVARIGSNNGFLLQPFYLKKAGEVIRAAPANYLVFHGINTAAVFMNTGKDDIVKAWSGGVKDINFSSYLLKGIPGMAELVKQHPLALAGKVVLLLLYFVMIIGFLLSWGSRKAPGPFLFLLLVVLAFGVTTGAVAEPRFRLPAQPYIFLLFVYSFVLVTQNSLTHQDPKTNLSA